MTRPARPLVDDPVQVIHPCCCGIDVHKKEIQACLVRSTTAGGVQQEHRTFSTMTDDLLVLVDWLVAVGCTHVAMESTGVYTSPMMLPKRSLGGNM